MKLIELAKAIVAHDSDVKVVAPEDEANGVYCFYDADNTRVNIPSDVEYDHQVHYIVLKTLKYMCVSSLVNFAFDKLLPGSKDLLAYITDVNVTDHSVSFNSILYFKRGNDDEKRYVTELAVSVEDGNVEVQRKINKVDALDYIIDDDASQFERSFMCTFTTLSMTYDITLDL